MSVELHGRSRPGYEEILTPDALVLLEDLHRGFEQRRRELLTQRPARRRALGFPRDTQKIRDDAAWSVAPPPADLDRRWVEITGPTDRKMVINALNSGADGFMADLEDSNSPTWTNMVDGQANLLDAVERRITHREKAGPDHPKEYVLNEDELAVLHVRPRGLHLLERHVLVDGEPIAGALFDAGLFLFHCARALLRRGSGPYLYIPKLESHLEARLWHDVLTRAEQVLGLPPNATRTTTLIETLPAAFVMEEILFELRERAVALNAGRWDYIFSAIKCRPEVLLPDRTAVKMTVPFMRAYTERLVSVCHRRGAHAMGGMAALIPDRKDPEANERALAAVREDKEREATAGYDGTWVAHPDLVLVAREIFARQLDGRPNQVQTRRRDDVSVTEEDLLALDQTPGEITEAGLRNDVSVGFQYISFWLAGRGAAGIDGLMEDAATAEIARSQIWQWVHGGATLEDGRSVTAELVRTIIDEETARIRERVGEEVWQAGRPDETRAIFERVALDQELHDFLTPLAYSYLP